MTIGKPAHTRITGPDDCEIRDACWDGHAIRTMDREGLIDVVEALESEIVSLRAKMFVARKTLGEAHDLITCGGTRRLETATSMITGVRKQLTL
jgi:hypothetical protein